MTIILPVMHVIKEKSENTYSLFIAELCVLRKKKCGLGIVKIKITDENDKTNE